MKLAQKLAVAVTGISMILIAMQAKSVQAASLNYGAAFQATGVDTAHKLGLYGTGVKIGVISDSFDTYNTYQTDIANGYLPPGIKVLQDTQATDEGRAMLEIVHAIAPGASLLFHSVSTSPTESGPNYFAKAVYDLKNAGANIIVDDIGYDNNSLAPIEPIDVAIQSVFDQGVAYFTSAGNDYRNKPILNFKNDPKALTVGAVYYGNDLISPRRKDGVVTRGQLEPFSSMGVAPYNKPDISAPDGLNISFNLNGNSPVDTVTHFYNFYGTSAAAPFSAAVAALLRQAYPNATPSQIYSALRGYAKPLGPNQPGFNTSSGYGLIQFDTATPLEPNQPDFNTSSGYPLIQFDKALLALGAKPKQVPENSSTLTLLTLGILGAGLLVKRHQQQKVLAKA